MRFVSQVLVLAVCFFALNTVFTSKAGAQALPIAIDGSFDDWGPDAITYTDPFGGGPLLDLLSYSVANNEEFIFIRLEVDRELKLLENHILFLYIDTDHNASTGLSAGGLGAEIAIDLAGREAHLDIGALNGSYNMNDIRFRSLPSVTAPIHEIAISRLVKPDGFTSLFPSDSIRILFLDQTPGGDRMPDAGDFISYTFDESPIAAPEAIPLERQDPTHLRLLSYNVLSSGLSDPSREQIFCRIFDTLDPDIIALNECWGTSANEAISFLDFCVPLGGVFGWYGVKIDGATITLSKYPVMGTWDVLPGRRITASLIDLPPAYEMDILVLNAHFACCSADAQRQRESDAIISFLKDAKTPGGEIDLPEGTPFVLMGDLNLVGDAQQLRTLTTGDIVDTGQFGTGGPPDWDQTNLEDLVSRHPEKRMSYTWRNDNSSFTPGRLDFMIYSNSVMEAAHAYTLQTESMSASSLQQYGLFADDTPLASDHLPKITDFSIDISTAISPADLPDDIKVMPVPFSDELIIQAGPDNSKEWQVSLKTIRGEQLRNGTFFTEHSWNTEDLPAGIYLLVLENGRRRYVVRVLKQ